MPGTKITKRGKRRRQRQYRDKDCHLCGFPIPENVLSQQHPLLGTEDHVVPKAKEGDNHRENLKPAHRICNQLRGDAEITLELRERCAEAALKSFRHFGMPQGDRFATVKEMIRRQAEASQ